MGNLKSKDFIKHVYTAQSSPMPLQKRTLVLQKSKSKTEETYLAFLSKTLCELKALDSKEELDTWAKDHILKLEKLLKDSGSLTGPVFNKHIENLKAHDQNS